MRIFEPSHVRICASRRATLAARLVGDLRRRRAGSPAVGRHWSARQRDLLESSARGLAGDLATSPSSRVAFCNPFSFTSRVTPGPLPIDFPSFGGNELACAGRVCQNCVVLLC